MGGTILRAWMLIDLKRRRRFIMVGVMSTFVSLLEAIAALLVAVLLAFVLDAGQVPAFPVIGDVTRFFPSLSYEQFVLLACGTFAVFFVVRAIAFLGQQYVMARVVENTGVLLADRMVDGYLSMDYEWHLQRNSAELIRNAYDNVQQVTAGVFNPLASLIAEFTLAAALLMVVLIASPAATLVAGVVIGVALTVTMAVVQPKLRRLGRKRQDGVKGVMQDLQEAFGGIRDLKVLGREAAFSAAFLDSRRQIAEAGYVQGVLMYLPRVTIEVTFLILVAGALAFAVTQDDVDGILSTLGLFAYAGTRLQPSIQKIAGALNSIKFAEAAVDDLGTDLAALDESRSARLMDDRDLCALPLAHEMTLQDVAYAYPGQDRPALEQVGFTIAAGESIGIAGATGGGKTTLLDLLCGLLAPSSGAIRVDGRDLAEHVRAWQRGLGVVHQASFLLDDTIRSNIAFGVQADLVDDALMNQVIGLAQLGDVIAELPDGLATVVGERGVRLSGGQRQRITLARALYRQPSVLILDEGTASLDNETERRVIEEIRSLGNVTLIMVAHRLTTIEQCDRIVVVDAGRIAGIGTYKEMLSSSTAFRMLAATSA